MILIYCSNFSFDFKNKLQEVFVKTLKKIINFYDQNVYLI